MAGEIVLSYRYVDRVILSGAVHGAYHNRIYSVCNYGSCFSCIRASARPTISVAGVLVVFIAGIDNVNKGLTTVICRKAVVATSVIESTRGVALSNGVCRCC